METHKLYPTFLTEPNRIAGHRTSPLWKKYLDFVDSQSEFSLAWWIGSLLLQSVLLPLTFLLVYTWNGPTLPFLTISMVCFFTNVIANMGGAPFRFRFNSFLLSVIIHTIIIITTLILVQQ